MISLIVNADGAPIFKSSKTSAWPLMCAISELPPTARSFLLKLAALLQFLSLCLPLDAQVQCRQHDIGRCLMWP